MARAKITAVDVEDLVGRVRTLERETEQLNNRLKAVERAQTAVEVDAEMKRIESKLAPIEAAVQAKRIEAAVRAEAARIAATVPHYPRA